MARYITALLLALGCILSASGQECPAAGYTFNPKNGQCLPCPYGTYKTNLDATCVKCLPGATTAFQASTRSSDCICPTGYIMDTKAGCIRKYPCEVGTCYSIGDPHYQSFDGKYFDFQGQGEFNLVKGSKLMINTCMQPWYQGASVTVNRGVAIRNDAEVFSVAFFNGVVEAFVDNFIPVINGVYIGNGYTVTKNLIGSNVQYIYEITDVVVVEINSYSSFSPSVSGFLNIKVKISDVSYLGKIGGLCGLWDCSISNDFTNSDGLISNNAIDFGNSWYYPTTIFPNEFQCPHSEEVPNNPDVNTEVLNQATDCCRAAFPNEPLTSNALQACIKDVIAQILSGNEFTCKPEVLINAGYGQIKTCKPGEYLLNGVCTLCPRNTYSPNGEECLPCPFGAYTEATGVSSLDKCKCKVGVLDPVNFNCVLPANQNCPPRTCHSIGDPHFLTFDGIPFDYQSPGRYDLVRNIYGNLRIEMCNREYVAGVAVNDGAAIKLNSDLVVIKAISNTIKLIINGVAIVVTPNGVVASTYLTVSWVGTTFTVQPTGTPYFTMTINAYTSINYMNVQVLAQPSLIDTLRGICGVYNCDASDDLTTPFETQAADLTSFGLSWKEVDISLFPSDLSCPSSIGTTFDPNQHGDLTIFAQNCCRKRYPNDPEAFKACVVDLIAYHLANPTLTFSCKTPFDTTDYDVLEPCKVGEELVGESCIPCAQGFYSSVAGEPCVPCPTGSTTANVGSTSFDQCICPPGMTMNSNHVCVVGTCPAANCYSMSDPHFKSFDGKYYDVHTFGAFHLFKNSIEGVDAHVCHKRWFGSVNAAVNSAFAIKIGGDVFAAVFNAGGYDIYFNGGIINSSVNGASIQVALTISGTSKTAVLTSNSIPNFKVSVQCTPHTIGGEQTGFINIQTNVPVEWQSNVFGLCGAYDCNVANDWTLSTGGVGPFPDFVNSWSVQSGQELFPTGFSCSGSGSGTGTPVGGDDVLTQQAENCCAPLTGVALEACVFDVLAHHIASGNNPPIVCPDDITNNTNYNGLNPCPAGSQAVGDVCEPCPQGTFNDFEGGFCQPCPQGTTSVTGSVSLDQCRCTQPNFVFDPVTMTCVPVVGQCGTTVCGSIGDPHIFSFRNSYFDAHKRGEFVLAQNGDVQINTCHQEWIAGYSVSVNKAFSVKSGNEVFSLAFDNNNVKTFLNGIPIIVSFTTPSAGAELKIEAFQINANFWVYTISGINKPFSVRAEVVFLNPLSMSYISVRVTMGPQYYASTSGLCGINDCGVGLDLTQSDGIIAGDLTHFIDSWQVTSNSLFPDQIVCPTGTTGGANPTENPNYQAALDCCKVQLNTNDINVLRACALDLIASFIQSGKDTFICDPENPILGNGYQQFTQCNPGEERINGVCVPCRIGFYNPTGEGLCTPCPTGAITAAVGSIYLDQCICPTGTQLSNGVCLPNNVQDVTCYSSGDPHFKSFNNIYFDYQGVGDYYLVKSDDGMMTMETCQVPWWPGAQVSINHGYAIRFDDDFFEIKFNGAAGFVVTQNIDTSAANNLVITIVNPSTYFITDTIHSFEVTIYSYLFELNGPNGVLNINVKMTPIYYQQLNGLCNVYDFSGQFSFIQPGGQSTVNENIFGPSWLVPNGQSIFTNGFCSGGDQGVVGTPVDVNTNPAVLQQAQDCCSPANIGTDDPAAIEACVLDVVAQNLARLAADPNAVFVCDQGFLDVTDYGNLVPCHPGEQLVDGICTPCPLGTFNVDGLGLCDPCPEGSITGRVGASSENECQCIPPKVWDSILKKCVNRACGDATCYSLGDPHFNTFDGVYHDFQGMGTFRLVESNVAGLSIDACQQAWFTGASVSVNVAVALSYYNEIFSLFWSGSGFVPHVDGVAQDIAVGNELTFVNLKVQRNSLNEYRVVTNDGLVTLIVNSYVYQVGVGGPPGYLGIYVKVNQFWNTKVNGLCGYFDCDASNEFFTPNGSPVSLTNFGNSWSVLPVNSIFPTQFQCTAGVTDTGNGGTSPFEEEAKCCREYGITGTEATEACIRDLIAFNQGNTVFVCDPFIDNNGYNNLNNCPAGYELINGVCKPCPIGTYNPLINGRCVKCPINSITAQEASTSLDQCICEEGFILDTNRNCVLPKCKDAVCHSSGDPHFFTFDGKYYDYQYPGPHTLTKSCKYDDFLVQTCQQLWSPGYLVSVNRAAAIRYQGAVYAVAWNNLANDFSFYINNVEVPIAVLGNVIGASMKVTRTSSNSYKVDVFNGVSILLNYYSYSGLSSWLNVQVNAPAYLATELCGLCGFYDCNYSNDIQLRNGTLETNIDVFGKDWKDTTSILPTSFKCVQEGSIPSDVNPPVDVMTQAEDCCKNNGITRPQPLAACINDVAALNMILQTGTFKCDSEFIRNNGYSNLNECALGEQRVDGGCKTCDPNTYNDVIGENCKSCPNGKVSPSGSDSLSDCVCPQGQVYDEILNKCVLPDPCVPNPCDHGKCEISGTTFKCICDSGFTGALCSQDINECINKPCLIANSFCNNLIGNYECLCLPGFTGDGDVSCSAEQRTIELNKLKPYARFLLDGTTVDSTGKGNTISIGENRFVSIYERNNGDNQAVRTFGTRLVTSPISVTRILTFEISFNINALTSNWDFINVLPYPGAPKSESIMSVSGELSSKIRWSGAKGVTLGSSRRVLRVGVTHSLVVSVRDGYMVTYLDDIKLGTFALATPPGSFTFVFGENFNGYINEIGMYGVGMYDAHGNVINNLTQCVNICSTGQTCANNLAGPSCVTA